MKLKIIPAAVIVLALISCYHKPSDHDLRVAAKKIIRTQLIAPSTARFAPDDKVKIVREKGDKTFYISIYSDAKDASGAVVRKEWNLHLLYKGGSLPDIKNWKVIQ